MFKKLSENKYFRVAVIALTVTMTAINMIENYRLEDKINKLNKGE